MGAISYSVCKFGVIDIASSLYFISEMKVSRLRTCESGALGIYHNYQPFRKGQSVWLKSHFDRRRCDKDGRSVVQRK